MNCDSGHKPLLTTLLTTAKLYSLYEDFSSASLRNPHKFNINSYMDGKYYNLWSTDNDKTDANDDLVIKSVYDPSPVGYSLPASNAFTGFTTTGSYTWNSAEFNVKGGFDKGWYFYTKPNKQGNIFWFPASGFRHYGTGSLNVVSMNGYCWVSGPYNGSNGRYLSFGSDNVYPLNYAYRSYGFAVRSAEEKVLKYGLQKLQIVCSFGENCNISTLKIRIFII